jgi:hypothetical protein
MNHIIRIILALGLSMAAVLVILLSTEHFGPRARMDVFVAETIRSAVGQDVEIEQYVEANLPRHLQRDMVKAWVYRTTPYSMTQPVPLGQPISATDLITSYPVENFAFNFNTRPLPYPPEDLWCVKLKSADPTVPGILLIAFHKDIYTASWVVHEPIDVEAVLAEVGCQFSTQ